VRQAQARLPQLAVLFTSGYTENAIIHNGRLDADVLLLSKPYRREELARKLRTALDQAMRQGAASVPVAAAKPAPAPIVSPNEEATAAPVADGPVVLFVEDDALVRMTGVDHLEQSGMRVIEAANAEIALQALKDRSEIQVMLTDLGLPGVSGAELIVAARKLRPALPVGVLTGRSREVLVQDGVIGADILCLEKPYELDALTRAVQRLVSKPV
jgi:CheY-like chemotaxis protein